MQADFKYDKNLIRTEWDEKDGDKSFREDFRDKRRCNHFKRSKVQYFPQIKKKISTFKYFKSKSKPKKRKK